MKTDIVVSVSGQLDMELKEETTPLEIFKNIREQWGLKEENIVSPFVVVHDKTRNKYRAVDTDEEIGKVDPKREVVRAVMPINKQ